jgi:hypothetical protein
VQEVLSASDGDCRSAEAACDKFNSQKYVLVAGSLKMRVTNTAASQDMQACTESAGEI